MSDTIRELENANITLDKIVAYITHLREKVVRLRDTQHAENIANAILARGLKPLQEPRYTIHQTDHTDNPLCNLTVGRVEESEVIDQLLNIATQLEAGEYKMESMAWRLEDDTGKIIKSGQIRKLA